MGTPSILEAIRQASAEDRALALAELVRSVADDPPPVPIAGPAGKTLGYFLRLETDPGPPPEMTAEDRADLQQALATRHQPRRSLPQLARCPYSP